MKLLVLADIDDLGWRGGRGRADALLALGDMADTVILAGGGRLAVPGRCWRSRATTTVTLHSRPPSSTCTCASWTSAA